MLNTKKNITLNGQSFVDEGEGKVMVANMTATLNSDGVLSMNKSIVRPDLYNLNKVAVKQDMLDFDTEAFDLTTTGTEVTE